jgi:hypothetical protein
VRDAEVDLPALCGAGFQPAADFQSASRERRAESPPQVENLPHKDASGLAHNHARFCVAHPIKEGTPWIC